MVFWESGAVFTVLVLGLLLLVAAGLRRVVRPLARLGMPDSMIAGALGLLLGPEALGVFPMDAATLELVVYHGLALMFIAVALQQPPEGAVRGGARSMVFAIPMFALAQGAFGLACVLFFTSTMGEALHPGFGLLLPLGFSQGPGQALSMGQAWEASGLEHGAQVGLIIAALGFAWCVVFGVPLVLIGRRMGWVSAPVEGQGAPEDREGALPVAAPGALEPITVHVAVVACVYLLAYGAILGLVGLLEGKDQLVAMIYGFHFLIGSLLAMAFRAGVTRAMGTYPFHSGLMGRIGGLIVDVVTCAALSALALSVLQANWLPILVITTGGGLITLLGSVWLARRAFPEAPFEHAVVLFGSATGTLPTGMALLRILDPELRGPAASNAVIGATAAVIPGAPLLLVVLPHTLAAYPENFPGATWESLGMVLAYMALLMGIWRFAAPLRFLRPLLAPWPERREGG